MIMNLCKIAAALTLIGLMPWTAFAEESSETSLKIEGQKNTTSGEDIDQTITNNKMRAETGSKSKFSFSSQLNYIGGTVNAPLEAIRPDISGATGTTDVALFGGQISGKFNISPAQSLMAGLGVRWITPLQGSTVPDGYEGKKVDGDNPYLIYQYLYKWSGIQSAMQFQPTYYTNSNLINQGYVATFALSQNNIYEVGHSGLSLGLYLLAQTGYYNNNSDAAKAHQSDQTLNCDPFLEYKLTDKANLRETCAPAPTSSTRFINPWA